MTDRLANYKFRVICRECGGEFGAQRSHALFCAETCRKVFHNRRMKRGAEVYDFLMGKRYDRDRGGKGVNEKLCREIIDSLVQGYREADQRYRDGRKSFLTSREAMDALGRLAAVCDER